MRALAEAWPEAGDFWQSLICQIALGPQSEGSGTGFKIVPPESGNLRAAPRITGWSQNSWFFKSRAACT